MLTIVVAVNKDNVIGVDNQLPWHVPEDLQHFKAVTMNKPIIMGRKTFESIGRVLPGRKNIVITRNTEWQFTGVDTYPSLEEAIRDNSNFEELCIIGGGEIFAKALPLVEKIHLTIIDIKIPNPTVFFPQIDYKEWTLIHSKDLITSNGIKCVFNEYIRSKR